MSDSLHNDFYKVYLDKLLKLQFDCTEEITHNLTKGEVRENLLKQLMLNNINSLIASNLVSGQVKYENLDKSKQIDIILLKPYAFLPVNNVYYIKDCILFMEVKSKATTNEIKDFNNFAKENANSNIECGMFCFNTQVKHKTVLEKFGFDYDLKYGVSKLDNVEYENIDFFINIDCDNNEPYLVIKEKKNRNEYELIRENVVYNFLNFIRYRL